MITAELFHRKSCQENTFYINHVCLDKIPSKTKLILIRNNTGCDLDFGRNLMKYNQNNLQTSLN